MKRPHRRQFLHLAAGAAALPALSRIARAQAYPSRPVRWVIGFPAGGPQDIVARLMGHWLSERLGQPFVVENRVKGSQGDSVNYGTEVAVKAPPDGHTLLLIGNQNTINATLYDKLNFDFIRDIAPIAGVIRMSLVIVVHPRLPVRTLPEFIAYAKANPGKLTMASSGIGAPTHISGELFKAMTGVNIVHLPYPTAGAATTALLAGQAQVLFAGPTASVAHIRTGKLRALAVTTATRSEALPDIPTVGDFVPGFEASSWYGLGAPKNTPAELIGVLNKEINAALADPKIKARLTDLGSAMPPGSPADFGKLIADETEKWGKVIRAANIKAE